MLETDLHFAAACCARWQGQMVGLAARGGRFAGVEAALAKHHGHSEGAAAGSNPPSDSPARRWLHASSSSDHFEFMARCVLPVLASGIDEVLDHREGCVLKPLMGEQASKRTTSDSWECFCKLRDLGYPPQAAKAALLGRLRPTEPEPRPGSLLCNRRSKRRPIKTSASHGTSMGQSHTNIIPSSSSNRLVHVGHIMWQPVVWMPGSCWRPIWNMPDGDYGDPCPHRHVPLARTSLRPKLPACARTGSPRAWGPRKRSSRKRATGAIAHSRMALGSNSSQSSLRPTHSTVGIRGTRSTALPVASWWAATARAKHSGAVFSASSLLG